MRPISGVMAWTVLLGLGICSAASTTLAGQTGSSTTVKEDLLKDWQAQKKTLMEIADAMPADKFDYKATPAERSYDERVMHIAQVNVGLLKTVGGKAPAPAFTPKIGPRADFLVFVGALHGHLRPDGCLPAPKGDRSSRQP